MKKIITIISLTICSAVFAADNTNAPVEKPAATQPVKEFDAKDAFLKLILEKAEKYSEAGENAIEKAVDIVSTESPVIAKEFVVWRACMHGIKSLVSALLIAAIIIAYIKITKLLWKKSENSGPYDEWDVGAAVFSGAGGIIGVAFIFITALPSALNNFLSFIQCLVAPRVYIIEQVIEFIKNR